VFFVVRGAPPPLADAIAPAARCALAAAGIAAGACYGLPGDTFLLAGPTRTQWFKAPRSPMPPVGYSDSAPDTTSMISRVMAACRTLFM
jgi:hypothetical protein